MTDPDAVADCPANVYSYVREAVVSGRYKAGQRLLAQDIARAVGVSRTPVRDALGRLCQDGFVEQDQAGGYMVKALSLADIEDLFGVREVLEQEAARQALRRVDATALHSLDALLQVSEQALGAGNAAAAISAARRFHLAVAGHGGNALLLQMIESISDRIHMLGLTLIDRYPTRAGQVIQENRAILSALQSGDEAALREAVHLHVQESRALIFRRS